MPSPGRAAPAPMRPLLRAAPLAAGLLAAGLLGPPALAQAAPAQAGPADGPAAGPVHLTTVSVGPAPVDLASGPVRLAGTLARARPLASGPVRVWGTVSAAAGPEAPPEPDAVAEAAPAAAAAEVPAAFALRPVYPNPLASRARVPYELPEGAAVRVSVYDALGREVAVLAEGDRPAGYHEAGLEARSLAPGLYVVRLRAGAFVAAHRFTVVR